MFLNYSSSCFFAYTAYWIMFSSCFFWLLNLFFGLWQIQAIDIDASPNGQNVKYSCCSPTNDTNQLFKVNSEGRVIVAASSGLVGHSGIYSLTVHASDWGTPSKTGSAKVIVRVIDFNDHKPVLSVYNNRTTSVNRPEVRTLFYYQC